MLDDADVDGDTRSRWLATDGDRDVGEGGRGEGKEGGRVGSSSSKSSRVDQRI